MGLLNRCSSPLARRQTHESSRAAFLGHSCDAVNRVESDCFNGTTRSERIDRGYGSVCFNSQSFDGREVPFVSSDNGSTAVCECRGG